MNAVIIACNTLRDEVEQVIRETGTDCPVIWIESGLHVYPDKLRDKIQAVIDTISNVDYLLMAFGFCGNALADIRSSTAKIVVPRVDDCITMLLGSFDRRKALSEEAVTYFLTRGWIVNEQNILKDYENCINKFGPAKGERIMKVMLKHYKRLTLIDTGAFPMDDPSLARPEEMAARFELEYQTVPGSLDYLKKLITGPWEEEFVVLSPGETLSINDFACDGCGESYPSQMELGQNCLASRVK